jgi:hypothetical protein
MRKIAAVVLVGFAVVLVAGCGFDLVKFAAEQQALQIARQTSRVVMNGYLVEPPYNPVLVAESAGGYTVSMDNTSVWPNQPVKLFPPYNPTTKEKAQQYLDKLEKDLEVGQLLIMQVPNVDYGMRPLTTLDEMIKVAESSKKDSEKIEALMHMNLGYVEGPAKDFLDGYKKFKEFKAYKAAEEKKKADAEAAAAALTPVPAAK